MFTRTGKKIKVSAEFKEDEWLLLCMALGAMSGTGFSIGNQVGWTVVKLTNQLMEGYPDYTPYLIPKNKNFKPSEANLAVMKKNIKALEEAVEQKLRMKTKA